MSEPSDSQLLPVTAEGHASEVGDEYSVRPSQATAWAPPERLTAADLPLSWLIISEGEQVLFHLAGVAVLFRSDSSKGKVRHTFKLRCNTSGAQYACLERTFGDQDFTEACDLYTDIARELAARRLEGFTLKTHTLYTPTGEQVLDLGEVRKGLRHKHQLRKLCEKLISLQHGGLVDEARIAVAREKAAAKQQLVATGYLLRHQPLLSIDEAVERAAQATTTMLATAKPQTTTNAALGLPHASEADPSELPPPKYYPL